MYKLLREILSELKSINKKLQVIESDKEQKSIDIAVNGKNIQF